MAQFGRPRVSPVQYQQCQPGTRPPPVRPPPVQPPPTNGCKCDPTSKSCNCDLSQVGQDISNTINVEVKNQLGQQLTTIQSQVNQIQNQLNAITKIDVAQNQEIAILRGEIDVLKKAKLRVLYEGGDDPDELERVEMVPLANGTIVIPPQKLQMQSLDKNKQPIGEATEDWAPAGMPLKIRNRLVPLKGK